MEAIRKEIQNSLDDSGEEYTLLTDEQLASYLSENGCGVYEFHSADIDRVLIENMRMKQLLNIQDI